MKTSELIGPALDWAVCKAGGGGKDIRAWKSGYWDYAMYHYSTDWTQGGPLIEREKIRLSWCHPPKYLVEGCWAAECSLHIRYAKTPLIAAMRCYVASKLGNEVEIPKELLT